MACLTASKILGDVKTKHLDIAIVCEDITGKGKVTWIGTMSCEVTLNVERVYKFYI